jgi:hypothetical protein
MKTLAPRWQLGILGRKSIIWKEYRPPGLILLDLIESTYVETSTQSDFARTAEFFTLDVISDNAFGKSWGFLDENRDMYDYIKTTEETLPFAVLVGSCQV